MKAVIMAGGEGKRLRPLTCTMPKPMVPLLNKPVIGYCFDHLKEYDITDVCVTLCYLPKKISEYYGNGNDIGLDISYSTENEPLGTAGSVKKAIGVNKEAVLVVSGDALTDFNINEMIIAHRRSGASVTMLLKKVRYPTEYGVVMRDSGGYIKRFLEKPEHDEVFSDLANTGIYILESDALDMIPDGIKYDFSKDLFPKILQANMRINGYITEAYWNDIGDIAQYMATQRDMLDGKCAFQTTAHEHDGVYIEEGANVSENAVLLSPCYIGSGAEIADNAFIGSHSVIGTNVRIEKRADIKRSVVLNDVVIRSKAELRGALVCEKAHVDSKTLLLEGAVLGKGSRAGEECTIESGICIWPDKFLEPNTVYLRNVIWDNDAGRFRPDVYKSGYGDNELIPETALKAGAAFALHSRLPSQFAVACDGMLSSAVIRHAVIAGISSQGVDIQDMGACVYSSFSNAIRRLSLEGGIYVMRDGGGDRKLRLVLCDETGLPIERDNERKLRQNYYSDEARPCTSDRLGIIEVYSNADRLYEGILMNRLKTSAATSNVKRLSVVIAGNEMLFMLLARMLLPNGVKAYYMKETDGELVYAAMERGGAKLGIIIDAAQKIAGVLVGERFVDINECVCAIALLNKHIGVLPVSSDMPEEYIELLHENGIQTSKCNASCERNALKSGEYDAAYFETETMTVELIRLAKENMLDKIVERIPIMHRASKTVGCSWREIGRVIRGLVEREKDGRVELINGITVKDDAGWVSIRPENTLTAFRVAAHGMSEEYAAELCDIYADKIRAVIKDED